MILVNDNDVIVNIPDDADVQQSEVDDVAAAIDVAPSMPVCSAGAGGAGPPEVFSQVLINNLTFQIVMSRLWVNASTEFVVACDIQLRPNTDLHNLIN